ncbi:hypothetical protein [Brevundimonas sp. Leaf280]|uniref:hypothetical protein n=1 Tax=Brevundimonas sp. Leaf280 TaxID=1736320 RepID=UPI000A71D832|nr:hypothetical protein [Brevundimonas sp. Leaf280]
MFSKNRRLFFAALYGSFVLVSLWLYGIPSEVSEVLAIFVVPGLAACFLYLFYGGVFSRAKKLESKRPAHFDQQR